MTTNNTKKTHFVFDVDDTLVDGRLFCGETMARSINKFEPEIHAELIIALHEAIRGGTIVDLYKSAIEKFSLKTPIESLLEEDARIQKSEAYKIRAFDGVSDILQLLKSKGSKLHICTNRKLETLEPILKENKLFDYFDTIISCIDQGHKKPEAACMLDIISKNGGNKDEFVYFGDSEVDYLFAKNSGVEYIIFDQYLNGKNLFKKLINLFVEN